MYVRCRPFEIALCLCLYAGAAVQAGTPPVSAQAQDVVRIVVRSEASVCLECIRLEDVASLVGGSAALQQRLAYLDLADLPEAGRETIISRDQIGFRIQIAGLTSPQFRLEGAERVSVSRDGRQLTAQKLESAARQLLSQRLPWQPENVDIRLAEPIELPALALEASDQVDLQAELAPGSSLAGLVCVEVAMLVNGQAAARAVVKLDVRPYLQVAIAARRLERHEVLSRDSVHADRRAVDGHNYLTYEDSLAGKRARRPLLPGQVITSQDVEAVTPEHPVLVKTQARVKLVSRSGPLLVTAVGEALQDGHSGDVIRVRNIDSKKIVQGRVIDRATVAIDY